MCYDVFQACSAFYLMMKSNNELYKNQGFVRCHVQVNSTRVEITCNVHVYMYVVFYWEV